MSIQPLHVPAGFGFTADHDLVRKTARKFLGERCPITEVRRLIDDPLGYDPALWREIVELGWVDLGVDHLAMALLFEECGRVLLPAPLLPATLAALAGRTSTADAIATVALAEPNGHWAPVVTATARRDGDDWILDGTKSHVLSGADAATVLAPFMAGTELALFAVPLPTAGVTVDREIGVDSTRRMARITFTGARLPAGARLGGDARAAWNHLQVRAQLLVAAEQIGAATAILARTRDYAADRLQFDRPIGSFQAVKHPLVNVLIATEQARNLVYAAAALLDASSPQAATAVHMAKAAAGDALHFAADRGVQLHGGFGFTWDCDAHLYFKRSLWSNYTLGDPSWHRRQLAAALLG
jgi:alkylation response protein AidB-like acyl-CoA dehydrogenase